MRHVFFYNSQCGLSRSIHVEGIGFAQRGHCSNYHNKQVPKKTWIWSEKHVHPFLANKPNQETNEPTNKQTNKPTNKPTNQPTNQQTNQQTNKHRHSELFKTSHCSPTLGASKLSQPGRLAENLNIRRRFCKVLTSLLKMLISQPWLPHPCATRKGNLKPSKSKDEDLWIRCVCFHRDLIFWKSRKSRRSRFSKSFWNQIRHNLTTPPKTNIAMENPPCSWYLPGKMGIFMGELLVSGRVYTIKDSPTVSAS